MYRTALLRGMEGSRSLRTCGRQTAEGRASQPRAVQCDIELHMFSFEGVCRFNAVHWAGSRVGMSTELQTISSALTWSIRNCFSSPMVPAQAGTLRTWSAVMKASVNHFWPAACGGGEGTNQGEPFGGWAPGCSTCR